MLDAQAALNTPDHPEFDYIQAGFDRCPWPAFLTGADERQRYLNGGLFHAVERGTQQDVVRLGNFVERLLIDMNSAVMLIEAFYTAREPAHGR